ncbi:MAG: MBL fold metallo-hydrolase [Actinomycetota bacterium]
MTLEGTNTWLLAEPGSRECIVVDPGPDDESHLRAIADAAADCDQTVTTILLTHGHPDHAAGAPDLAQLCGARVLAQDPKHGHALPPHLDADGLRIDVVATPGHSADSVCFALPADQAVLTGDHVLGRGTSVVEYPEGRMGDYLASLARVKALHAAWLLPGHGPVVGDPAGVLDHYVRHREERLQQLLGAVGDGAGTPQELVRRIYRDTDPRLHPIAELTVRAGLELLVERGAIRRSGDGFSTN